MLAHEVAEQPLHRAEVKVVEDRREARVLKRGERSTFLILTGIGFWRELVEHALPHATFAGQDDRMVFTQLARTTPHCTFVTDAPYMENNPVPGRTVVPLEDSEAHVTFYLVARANATGLAAGLFDWCAK